MTGLLDSVIEAHGKSNAKFLRKAGPARSRPSPSLSEKHFRRTLYSRRRPSWSQSKGRAYVRSATSTASNYYKALQFTHEATNGPRTYIANYAGSGDRQK